MVSHPFLRSPAPSRSEAAWRALLPVVPPVLSIVTPTLNQGRFLARCIASVRDQPPGVAEHLVMDGGSTDGTPELLREGFHGPWRSGPDGGQSHAINLALGVRASESANEPGDCPSASASFATWLNADDWYQPGALGAVAEFLASNPETDVLVCNARFVAEDGRVVHTPTPPERIDEASLLMLRSVWFAGHSIVQPEVFFRLSLFRQVGGLDESNHHSMDHHLWLKFLEAGARVRRLDALVANQGVHHQQKTADRLEATRSIVRSSRAWLDRRGAHWPLRAPEVRAELDAIEEKLRLAARYAAILDRALAPTSATPTPTPNPEPAAPAHDNPPQDWVDALGAVLDRSLGSMSIAHATVIGPPASHKAIASALLERGVIADVFLDSVDRLERPTPGQPPRVFVLHAALTGAPDPREALASLVRCARPDDLLVLSALVARSELHDRYLRRLRARVVNKITQPDPLIIGPRADLVLRPLLESPVALAIESHPNPRGVDLPDLIAHAGRPDVQLVEVAQAEFGRMDNLPVAPFPTVPKLVAQTPPPHAWRTVGFVVR
jgi:GT2 family glycosyltransferase